MNPMTIESRAVPGRGIGVAEPRFSDLLARVLWRLQTLGGFLRMPAPGVPEATLQLLRLAEAYEATQPSYAADLRAAAEMSRNSTPR